MKKVAIIGAVLAVFLFMVLASPVLAGGLSVAGGKIETSVSPGNNYSYTIGVQNNSDAPMDIGVAVKGYGLSPSRDFIALEPAADTSFYSARTWLTASPTSFHLDPGASQVVTVTASIPAGTGDGGRYAIVLIQTVPPAGQQVSTISAIAARVLLTVSGYGVDTSSRITEVAPVNSTAQQPAAIMVTLADNGNYHYKPALQATLRNGGMTVATASLTYGWPILPGYSRQYQLDLVGNAPIPAGKYEADVEVKDESGNLITKGTFPVQLGETVQPLPQETTEIIHVQPPMTTAAIVTLTPGNAAVLEMADKSISISFAKGAVTGQVDVSLRTYPLAQVPTAPANYTATANCFRVDGLTGLLAQDATVTVRYTGADLTTAGGDVSRLTLARWDEATNKWSLLKTKADKSAMTLTAQTNQFSIWAVIVSPPAKTNRLLIYGAIAIGIILVAALVAVLTRKKKVRQ